MSVFDALLEAIEQEMFGGAVPRDATGVVPPEEEVQRFERIMSTVPHGDTESLAPAYQRMREEMGRDFLALGLMAGGYPPRVEPFLTGRDHRVVVAAALMTYPESGGLWWRTARLLGFRQMAAMPPREVLRVVRTSREFRPRARRFVNGCVRRYVGALARDRDAWQAQVLLDGRSLDELIRYCNVPVPAEHMEVLRSRKAWEAEAWPRLALARELSEAARQGDRERVTSLLKEAGRNLPLLYVEGLVNIYEPGVAPYAVGMMTPKQLLQRMDRLARGGLLENSDVREKVLSLLERATRDERVAPADVRRVRETVGSSLPEEFRVALERLEEERRERLVAGPMGAASWRGKSVCLIVDRSGSMEPAIVAASQLAAYLADQGANVKAVAFAEKASVVEPEVAPDGRPDWRATFAGLRASGWTSIGSGINLAHRVAPDADLWVVLTDGAENRPPYVDRQSPRPQNGRVAVMWFNRSPSRGFFEWCSAVGAEEFHPQVRGGRLDFAALDDLVRLCMGSDAVREWLSTVPSHVVDALLRGADEKAHAVVDALVAQRPSRGLHL
ncbi:von Willebrand factor type A [Thermanaeromonas toyohensis ToBE]|uniref:von Willebrand factor type A n=1 Tax=Thermanaeromonas toyohensis ToBE TaxID=698762 RepID=A0A1W1VSK5_9FIRM|nr:vWA domain-containing protein [Thermanaeromonas toyohensis]SMB96347.1 von Willebrand factor type A [Thermanaeromonas toyohensis ToBE]